MKKKLYYTRNILFILTIILLIINYRGLGTTGNMLLLVLYPLLIIMSGIIVKQYLNKNVKINLNNRYNISFIISMLFVLIVILRSMFDKAIIVNSIIPSENEAQYLNTIFLSMNLLYITIIMLCLVAYNIFLSNEKIPKKKKHKATGNAK